MRQERITKQPRRRTTRQPEAAPLVLPQAATDLTEAEAVLEVIEHVLEAQR